MFKLIHRTARAIIVFTFASLIIFILAIAWFGFGVHIDSRTIDTRISFWMEHAWATGVQYDFTDLTSKVKDYGITDLYFHVGPLSETGDLSSDLNIPTAQLTALPTNNYAWLGQVRSKIDLDNSEVRAELVESAKWTLGQGFDAIHLDIEPVRSDDEGFYSLLEELRLALPETPISVAMDEWQPHYLSRLLSWSTDTPIESYWTKNQVKRVAELADQIVVMTYDTNFHDPNLYEWWVEQQTIAISQFLPNDTELFIGIPSYDEGESIDPEAENLQTGLTGFNRAVQNLRSNSDQITGVAIYAYWEMDEDEWNLLK